ncbi:cation:proton antiporter [Bhargavaea cecembensis]|uniref:cation:proton antiporter n=1 Tax=Bhargavaea cecembensis TaxID=394098 RepID=UPI00058F7507|nr:sodium:proton antiporter [Bhargavaea cecembensis]
MFGSFLFDMMMIGALGIGSQWVAWKLRLPAIVVMSVAGLLVGPVFGLINPEQGLGDFFTPIISIAVAIILFEGSLNLDFREIRGFSKPVGRIVTAGAFLAWILGSLAAHYVAGLSWEVAFVIGGLFIVTGPTVILPLLRQARLKPRVAAILKWEGIVVDPFGALVALFAFQTIRYVGGDLTGGGILLFFAASAFAGVLGWFFGWGLGRSFERDKVPEFLKSPVLFAAVLFVFVLSNEVMDETGLLAVTVMGMTMANMHLSSIDDIRHFKENISVLLVSYIFVMLTASLHVDTLLGIFQPRIIAFVLATLFLVRPLSIWLSTIGTDLTNRERTLVSWIAPRGIVALTVSGYFASILLEHGYEDAEMLTALTFALVFGTVLVHGFTLGPLAKKLNLVASDSSGVLVIGGGLFSARFAKSLKDDGKPAAIMDDTWHDLSEARKLGVDVLAGDVLSEQVDYRFDLTPYQYMLSLTHMDLYNARVCSDFAHDLGNDSVYRAGLRGDPKRYGVEGVRLVRSPGKFLFDPALPVARLDARIRSGHVIRKTPITDRYTYTQYLRERDESPVLLYILRKDGRIDLYSPGKEIGAEAGDIVVSLSPPDKTVDKVKERLEEKTDGAKTADRSEIERKLSSGVGGNGPVAPLPGPAPDSAMK